VLAYALTILLSSFLLFLIQPLAGKHLLPWFGGTSSVWTTCLLFFQVLLLGGYAYAHLIVRRLSLQAQRRLHTLLLALSVLLLAWCAAEWGAPLLPEEGWRPADPSRPAARILVLLAASVGLPYFLLATTAPLLQGWLARERTRFEVYRLYAISNLGALAAPLAFVFGIEPNLTLRGQAFSWSAGYILFATGAAYCAAKLRPDPHSLAAPAPEAQPRRGGPAWLWFTLSACGSLMLLAATNQMTQEVAAIPFLWVLPLGLYLLSFILVFQSERLYSRAVFGPVLAFGLGFAALVLHRGFPVPARTQIIAYSIALFASCMVCHGELARARPEPARLTSFYLAIAAGGAAGGIFVALIAPLLFPAYWEIHVALFLSGLLAVLLLLRDRRSWLHRGRSWPALLVLLASGLLAHAARRENLLEEIRSQLSEALASGSGRLRLLLVLAGIAALVVLLRPVWWARGRPYFAAASLAGALLLLGFVLFSEVQSFLAHSVSVSRNFYGVLTVEALDRGDAERSRLVLRHGRIVHGTQYQRSDRRRIPTSYYGERSGVRRMWRALERSGRPLRVGVVGLGTGTLAAYGRAGDTFRFYEINPQVIRFAEGPGPLFTYLRDSPARIEVVSGDARLSLERERARRLAEPFDLLVVDAFSSDSIPVHLLTREALKVYLARLRPEGVLALHVSNRHLDLEPVAAALGDSLGLHAVVVDVPRAGETELASMWVLLSRVQTPLAAPEIAPAAKPLRGRSLRVWTDDYSNLLEVLN
jgi:hypothetical protein